MVTRDFRINANIFLIKFQKTEKRIGILIYTWNLKQSQTHNNNNNNKKSTSQNKQTKKNI